MKTIEELRERKRVLLEKKERELALQAEGKGDNMALFIVEEELLDVNDHIRALDPRHRAKARSGTTNNAYAMERHLYLNWTNRDGGDNREARSAMSRAIEDCDLYLTRKQQEVFDLWRSGMGVSAMAERIGVDKSTVSRTLAAAKRSIREGMELAALPTVDEVARLDVSDPATANLVLACVTAKQAVYLYLYYGEGLSLREISGLVGVHHTTVSHALSRALAAVSKSLSYREAVLDNLEVLGDLAYQLYIEGFEPLASQGTLRKGPDWARAALGKEPRSKRKPETQGPVTVTAERSKPDRPGKLLAALTQSGPNRLWLWLTALFAKMKKTARRGGEKSERK